MTLHVSVVCFAFSSRLLSLSLPCICAARAQHPCNNFYICKHACQQHALAALVSLPVSVLGDAGKHQPVLTLLCSSKDKALFISSFVWGMGLKGRAGLYMAGRDKSSNHTLHPYFKDPVLDTVDASHCGNDWFSHGYFASSRYVVADIALVAVNCWEGQRCTASMRLEENCPDHWTVEKIKTCPGVC